MERILIFELIYKNDIVQALQFHFDLASLNDADMPELEPIEYKNDSDDDIMEMFRNPSERSSFGPV